MWDFRYYNAHWYSAPEEIETIAVIHRGGNEILAQFPNEFGSTTVGFLDLSSSTLHLNSCSNRNMTRTLIGKSYLICLTSLRYLTGLLKAQASKPSKEDVYH